jgi:hypothetical protein
MAAVACRGPRSALLRLLALLTPCALLAACGAAPTRPQWAVEPMTRIEHAGGDAADAFYQVGRYHQQRGEPATAAEAFARAIALRPDRLEARNAQAVLLAGQGREAEAIALLRQLLAEFPQAAQPRNNLGYLYQLQGRSGQAREAFEQALRIDPTHAQARANLARLMPSASTPAPANPVAAQPGPDDSAARPRLQLVQVAPNEFSLRALAAPDAMQAAGADQRNDADVDADADPAQSIRLQVVNGNGVRGLGERTRRVLASSGVATAANTDVVNQRGHHQRRTVIEYIPGQRARADLAHLAINGPAMLLPVSGLPGGLSLRLVLGSDHAGSIRVPAPRLAATTKRTRLPHGPLLTMRY